MSDEPKPVIIVDADEYAGMRVRLRFEENWHKMDEERDYGRAGAEAFIEHFDPERADEWGHIAFCIGQAHAVERQRERHRHEVDAA